MESWICTFMNALEELMNLIQYDRKNYCLWVEIGNKLDAQGNYLFFDPADEEPNEEIVYFEFSSDKSQFTHDTGEVIQIWERQ